MPESWVRAIQRMSGLLLWWKWLLRHSNLTRFRWPQLVSLTGGSCSTSMRTVMTGCLHHDGQHDRLQTP